MYPPLCFTDSALGTMGEKSRNILKEEIGECGYEIVSGESVRVVPALKLLELWGVLKENARKIL